MRGRGGGGGSERPAEQRWNRPWQTARLCSPPSDSVISCFLLYPFHYVLSFSLPPLTPLSFPPKLCDRGQWCIRNSGPPASPDPHYIWKAAVFFSFWASPFIPVKHLWTPFCFLYTYKHRNMCLHTRRHSFFFLCGKRHLECWTLMWQKNKAKDLALSLRQTSRAACHPSRRRRLAPPLESIKVGKALLHKTFKKNFVDLQSRSFCFHF